jgi:DNA polymerase III epsilon subunit-like protein
LGTHRKMNTGDLAWPLVAAGLVEKTGLETLAAFLGVEHQAHTAMGDVKACVKVYEILCERFIHSPRKLRELCAAIIPGLEPKSDRAEARELLNAIVVM